MSDDLDPDVRQLVELARQGRTPGDEAKSRIAERLAVPLAASAAIGTTAAAAKATAGAGAKVATAGLLGSVGAKVVGAALVLALGATVLVSQRPAAPVATPPQLVAPAEPVMVAPLPVASAVEASPAPTAEPADVSPPAKVSSAPPAMHSSKLADELGEEAALLHQAQAAWRAGQSARALELASQHAQRFPRSQLANERDVLRVLSLCKLGQVSTAKQVGARLLRTAKGSPWYRSVVGSCAGN